MPFHAGVAALGAKIRSRRQELGLTQSRLAAMTEMSRATINALEAGTTDLGLAKVLRIAEVLGMNLNLEKQVAPASKSLETAAASASVSYRIPLPAAVIAHAAKTGEVAPEYLPHVATLLEEASPALLAKALNEVFPEGVPKSAWDKLARIGRETLLSRRYLEVDSWEALLPRALELLEGLGPDAFWTLGGGTVLMFRHNHRASRDLAIFFRDAQLLGHVNPRLGGTPRRMTSQYEESSGHVKLYFREGEIDFVASPLLTSPGFTTESVVGHTMRLESDVEIVAKKMWHRGHEARAQDLFDLSLVVERSPKDLTQAAEYLLRHRDAFLGALGTRRSIVKAQFESIDVRDYRPAFEDAVDRVSGFLNGLGDSPGRQGPAPG
jgi:transcriptional regulator with XRE-family HTH domain